MRDRRHENRKTSHALQSSIITLWLLHIFAFESVLQGSFEFFASIHLLVFGSPFIVSQRLGGWVVSERLPNKSARSSSYSPGLLLHVFSDIRFSVFWVKSHFKIRRSRRHCYYKQKSVDCRVLAKNLCGKIASTPVQNRRPDWDSRSVRSRFDVTALTLPRFPLRGREPSETRFWRGVEIRGFNQIKNFLRQITPQNKPFYISEKEFLVLGAL